MVAHHRAEPLCVGGEFFQSEAPFADLVAEGFDLDQGPLLTRRIQGAVCCRDAICLCLQVALEGRPFGFEGSDRRLQPFDFFLALDEVGLRFRGGGIARDPAGRGGLDLRELAGEIGVEVMGGEPSYRRGVGLRHDVQSRPLVLQRGR